MEKWYPLVGVLESFDETLSLLELILPRFFRGVKYLYENVLASESFNFVAKFFANENGLMRDKCFQSPIKTKDGSTKG